MWLITQTPKRRYRGSHAVLMCVSDCETAQEALKVAEGQLGELNHDPYYFRAKIVRLKVGSGYHL